MIVAVIKVNLFYAKFWGPVDGGNCCAFLCRTFPVAVHFRFDKNNGIR